MPGERRQFRVLCRVFLSRLVDLEIISAGGHAETLVQQFGAMLAAFSFVLMLLLVLQFAKVSLPPGEFAIAIRAWRRTAEFARSRYLPVQFEDLPPEDVTVLDLHADGGLTGEERYVDA